MIYATSDWHGCSPEVIKCLLNKAKFDESTDHCYVIGDIIDRGEHVTELLNYIMERPHCFTFLLGNHEDVLLNADYLYDPRLLNKEITPSNFILERIKLWKLNGGTATIKAFKELSSEEIIKITDYFRHAPLYKELTVNGQKFLLVHGGIGDFEESKPLELYFPEDLLWHRSVYDEMYYEDTITIMGHTPSYHYSKDCISGVNRYKMYKSPNGSWYDIDTGAAAGGSPMLLRLDDMKEFYVYE